MTGIPETPIPAPVANFSNTKSIEINGASATGTCTLSGGVTFPGPTGCTYSLWINATAPTLAWKIMTMSHASGNTYELLFNGTSAKLLVYEGGTTSATIGSEVIAADTWYHVCITSTSTILGGGDIYMYVNGALVGSGSGTTLTQVTTVTIAPTFAFYGYIDEMAIWDAPLSAAQVATLYTNANGLGGKVSDINDIDITSTAAPRIWNTSTIASSNTSGGEDGRACDSSAIGSNIFVAYIFITPTPTYYLTFSKSIDGGTNWTTSTVDTTWTAGASIFAVDANNIFIGYRVSGGHLKFAKSTDGGDSWTVTTAATGIHPNYHGYYVTVFATDSSTIFMTYATDNGSNPLLKFAKSTDGGVSFTFSTVDSSAGTYNDLYALDSSNIFISYLTSTVSAPETMRVAKSTNGGTSWTIEDVDTNVHPYRGTSIWAVDTTTIYSSFISYTGNAVLAKSTDGGSSWTTSIVSAAGYQSLVALDANTIAMSYNPVLSPASDLRLGVSIDGGSSWTSDAPFDSTATAQSVQGPSLNAINSNTYYIISAQVSDTYGNRLNCSTSSVNSALRIWWRMGDLPDDTEGDPGYIYNAAPVPGAGATDNRLEVIEVTITTAPTQSPPASYDRFQVTTPANSGTGLVPRVLNQNSVTFDGVDQSYSSSVGSGPDFTVGGDGMSLNCNVKLNSTPSGIRAIFGQTNVNTGVGGAYTSFFIYMTGTTLAAYAADSSSGESVAMAIAGPLVVGTWYTVTVTLYPGGNMVGYIWGAQYGTPVAISAGFGAAWSANRCWSIGAWRWGVGIDPPLTEFADIQIDECTVFGLAVTHTDLIGYLSKFYYRPDWSTPPVNYMIEFEGKAGYPLAWWRMGDTAGDSATQMISPAGFDPYSTSFDGVDEYAASAIDVFDQAGAYTVSCWAKSTTDSSGTYYQTIVNLGGEGTYDIGRFTLEFIDPRATTIKIRASETSNDGTQARSNPSATGSIVSYNTWCHVVMTSTGDGDAATPCRIYVDGAEVDTWTGINWSSTTPAPGQGPLVFSFGARSNPYFFKLDGMLDECAMWTRVLPATGSESVASLYNSGAPTDLSVTHSTSLRNWWRMGDAPGDDFTTGVLEDVVGTSDLTLTAMDASNKSPDEPVGNTLTGSGLSASDIQDEIPIIYTIGTSAGGPYFAAPTIITPIQIPYTNPVPSIASSSPPSGPLFGGTTITISGTNFVGVSSVTVGGNPCTSVTTVSAVSITAVTPVGTTGAKDIVITASGGFGTLTNGFTYLFDTYSTSFDGVDEYAASAIDVFDQAGAYTVSCWAKSTTDSSGTYYQTIVNLGGEGTYDIGRFTLEFIDPRATTIKIRASETSNDGTQARSNPSATGSIVSYNTWCHVVMTSTGDGDAATPCRIYVDGAEVDTWTGINWSSTTPAPGQGPLVFSFGARSNPYFFKLDGMLDECAMWTRVLPATGSESIESLYSLGVPTDLSSTHSTNLRNWWRMGDASGDNFTTGVLEDVVGTSDLTLTAMDASNKATDAPS